MNFKKRVNGSWTDTPHYIHNTSADAITTLPAVLYPNDTTATVGLKGNTVQSTTPTPQNPVIPQGCGELETSGAHSGQYKIPLLSANTTTPVYLGEVQTTRQIQKLVLTGDENWTIYESTSLRFFYTSLSPISIASSPTVNTHFGKNKLQITAAGNRLRFYDTDGDYANASEWTTYLQQQYAAGTPVTIWYVLEIPETAVVNEPLQKIRDYADTLSNVSIPVSAGGDTISVDTMVQPSEVTVNYKGWHSVQSVHERSGGQWD